VLKRGPRGRARRVVSVAIALGLGLVYAAASELAAGAGAKGHLEPWLAVSLPHAAFLALGAVLYARMDR
jgi:lipopolysaccharide export LptBFGC system permease protein LptF